MKKNSVNIGFLNVIFLSILIISCNGIIQPSLPQRSWTQSILLATSTSGGNQQISCNESGTSFIIWEQSDGTRMNIWANRYSSGTGWGSSRLIESGSGTAANPQIAVDGSGNAIAVWQQSDGTRNNILANHYMTGTGWGTVTGIESRSYNNSYPQIAMNNMGNAVVVWQENSGNHPYTIWSTKYENGIGWSSISELISKPEYSNNPQVEIDNFGNAIAVWQNSSSRTDFISSNRYINNSGWGMAADVPGSGYGAYPQIASGNSDFAFIIWPRNTFGNYISASKYSLNTGWLTNMQIKIQNYFDVNTPQIAANRPGSAFAVWQEINDTEMNIWCNRYSPSSGWGTAELVETDPGNAEKPQVVLDDRGNAIVVWQQLNGARKEIRANRFTSGRGWDGAATIGAGVWGDMTDPKIAIDGEGNAIAVWSQNDASQYALWASRYRLASEN